MVVPRESLDIKDHEILNTTLKPSTYHSTKYKWSSFPPLNQLDQSCESRSIPKLCDLPSLDKDLPIAVQYCRSDSSYKSKPKRHMSVQFTDAKDQHPLAIRGLISTSISPSSKTEPLEKITHPTKLQNFRPSFFSAPACLCDEKATSMKNLNKETQELVEYSRRVKPFSLQPTKRFLRPNASYLRMFVAEKHMYLSGKLNRLKCGPLMHPRSDSISNEPAKILDIAYKWNKKPRTRNWVQLN